MIFFLSVCFAHFSTQISICLTPAHQILPSCQWFMFNVARIARPHDHKFFCWLQWAQTCHEVSYMSEHQMFCVECVLSPWQMAHFVADELKKKRAQTSSIIHCSVTSQVPGQGWSLILKDRGYGNVLPSQAVTHEYGTVVEWHWQENQRNSEELCYSAISSTMNLMWSCLALKLHDNITLPPPNEFMPLWQASVIQNSFTLWMWVLYRPSQKWHYL